MLLSLTTTHTPATDLGYLLHKHPDRAQSFPLTFGQAHVFYPEATVDRCTAVLLVEVDPIALVRGKSRSRRQDRLLEQYVNDRPYVASSLMSVAIAQVFGTALSGRCQKLPELVTTAIPLTVKLPVLPCRASETFLQLLFEPLGYQISAEPLPLDEHYPDWGNSPYYAVTLQQTIRLADLLNHLYVLLPVLDAQKHYWVGEEEVEKLLRHGEGWLKTHPAREVISRRYLKRQYRLTRLALEQLSEDDPDPDGTVQSQAEEEEQVEQRISLNQQRLETVIAALKQQSAKRVVDLGCGEGKLLRSLLQDHSFEQITGVDVSYRALELATERLHLDRLSARDRSRVQLIQGSLTYRDDRLRGYDAATLIEVIEHLDPDRLTALERVLFDVAQPRTVIVTTPNIEYNIQFENLPAGKLRHRDHRFEWTRTEFAAWANHVADRFGYQVEFVAIGPVDPEVGSPTQMAVFYQL